VRERESGIPSFSLPTTPSESEIALKGGRHAWALNEDESKPLLRAAFDLGINFFDTANVYSSGAS
jgi:aryl-alcohol dehydrogenase-like predicted oxidoreductase